MTDAITQKIDIVDEIETITFTSGNETFVFTLDAASLATEENIKDLIILIDNAIAFNNLNKNYISSFLTNLGFSKELATSIEHMYRLHLANITDALEYTNGDIVVTPGMVNAIYGMSEVDEEEIATEG